MKRTLLPAHGGASITALNASLLGVLACRHGIKPSDSIDFTDILLTGENRTMDTIRRRAKACLPLRHSGGWGIPKMIDNDIAYRDLGCDFTSFI